MRSSRTNVSAESLAAQGPWLRSVAMGLLLDEHHAEDAVQETMLRALEHNPERREGLGPWLRTVCSNLAINLRRSNRRRQQREAAVAKPEVELRPRADLTELLKAWVVEAMVSMREPYREALLLRYYEDRPPREIAQHLGVPVTTIYSRLQKGLQQLRTDLEKRRQESGLELSAKDLRLGLAALAGWPRIAPPPPTPMSVWPATALAGVLLILATLHWWPTAPEPTPGGAAAVSVADTDAPAAPVAAERLAATPVRRATMAADAAASHDLVGHEVFVRGRVVDLAQRAVARAAVTAFRKGFTPTSVHTDDAGHFTLPLATAARHPESVSVHVATTDGRAAARTIGLPTIAVTPLGTDRIELGNIAVDEAVAATIHMGTANRSAVLHARLLEHLPSGQIRPQLQEVYLGRHTADERGEVTLPLLPRGRILLRATDEGDGVGRCAVLLRSVHSIDGATMTWQPAITRRIRARDAQGRALANLPLQIGYRPGPGSVCTLDLDRPAATDSSGTCTVLVPVGTELVVARGDRKTVTRQDTFASVDGDVTLTVQTATRRAWQLPPTLLHTDKTRKEEAEAGDTALPEVAVVPCTPDGVGQAIVGRIEGTQLLADGMPADSTHAYIWFADGRRAVATCDDPAGLRLQTTRTLHVHVADEHGDGIAGLPITAAEAGGPPLLQVTAVTNGSGIATLPFVGTGAIELFASAPAPIGKMRRQHLGRVAAGNDDFELTVHSRGSRFVELHFVANGQPLLPPGLEISTSAGFTGSVSIDPEAATARFRAWTDRDTQRLPILVKSAGYRNEMLVVAFDASSDIARHTVPLHPLTPLHVRVAPPSDNDYELVLQTQLPAGRWATIRGCWFEQVHGSDYRAAGLHPGIYRVVDARSGRCGERIVVREDTDQASTFLDLSSARWLSGRLLLPAEADPSRLELSVSRPRGHLRPAVRRIDERYEVRFSGTASVTVTARHPMCGGDQTAATATVRADATPADIVLERGARVQFDVTAPTNAVRVTLFRAGSEQRVADHELHRVGPGEPFRFDAPPGRYDVRVDADRFAPAVRSNIELRDTCDLGTVSLPAGEQLAVELRLTIDVTAPPFKVTAVALDSDLRRSATSDDNARAILRGLLPGRYRIELRSLPDALVQVRVDREVRVLHGQANVLPIEVGRATPRKPDSPDGMRGTRGEGR